MTLTRMRQLGLAAAGVGLIGGAAWLLHTRLTGAASPSMVPNPSWFTGTGAGGGGGSSFTPAPTMPADPAPVPTAGVLSPEEIEWSHQRVDPRGFGPPDGSKPPPVGIPAGAPGSYIKTA
jgi:hypothetical protein